MYHVLPVHTCAHEQDSQESEVADQEDAAHIHALRHGETLGQRDAVIDHGAGRHTSKYRRGAGFGRVVECVYCPVKRHCAG
jgi:hypothetical protein